MKTPLVVTGTVYRILDTVQVTDSLSKRSIVIETTDEQQPNLIKMELVNEKCALADRLSIGDKVEVDFDLRGREWMKSLTETLFFTELHINTIAKL